MISEAVILAAGEGKRLGEKGRLVPKGFLNVGDTTLIERTLTLLTRAGIKRILIGTGHQASFFAKLKARFPELVCIENKAYRSTGSLETLCSLAPYIERDILLLESDILYEERALVSVLRDPNENMILTSGFTLAGDEVYVEANRDMTLSNLSKDRHLLDGITGEFVGIAKLSLNALKMIFDWVDKEVKRPVQFDYEKALVYVSTKIPIEILKLEDLLWGEADTQDHLERLINVVYPQIRKAEVGNEPKRNILLTPGPVTTSERVKRAMIGPDLCPREKEFSELLISVAQDLIRLIQGRAFYKAVFFPGSATGSIEATISSVVPPNKKILVIVNGAYGERIKEIAKVYFPGEHILTYEIPDGSYPNVDNIKAMFTAHRDISHIALVHHETSTGMLNPAKEILRIAHRHSVDVILDAVSSYGAIPIDTNQEDFDYIISTSNKCVQGVPGIAFVLAKREKLELLKTIPQRNYCLSLSNQYQFFKQNQQMQFTPPVQVFYALKEALAELFEEGIEARYKRYSQCWVRLVEGLESFGFKLLLPQEHQSKLLAAIIEPNWKNFSYQLLHDFMFQNGFTIYPGKVKQIKTFRVATMGNLHENDIDSFLDNLSAFLKKLKPKQSKQATAQTG